MITTRGLTHNPQALQCGPRLIMPSIYKCIHNGTGSVKI